MKRIHHEDPRVTAHALGELPEHEAAELCRVADSNPAIQAALDETAALSDMIRSGFKSESHELGEARREAIRRAGRRPVAENLISLQSRRLDWVRPALVSAAAAALVACAIWMMQQIPISEDAIADNRDERAQREGVRVQILLSHVSPPRRVREGGFPRAPRASLWEADPELSQELVDEELLAMRELLQRDPDAFFDRVREVAHGAGMPALSKLPLLPDNPFIPTREDSRSIVPIVSGAASYHLVNRFIYTEKKLPPKNGVRTEELINHVVYEDDGDAALDGIKLGVEMVRCPWKQGAILIGVLLQNGSKEPITRDSILQIEVKHDLIRSYRLLGYAGAPGPREKEESALSEILAPGQSNYIIYQLQLLDSEIFREHRVLGRIGLQLGGENDRGLIVPITSPPQGWGNASNNLQTAISLGAWGMLLRESPFAGRLSLKMLNSLTYDAMSGCGDGELVRREALQLVLDSLPFMKTRAPVK